MYHALISERIETAIIPHNTTAAAAQIARTRCSEGWYHRRLGFTASGVLVEMGISLRDVSGPQRADSA